MLNLFWIKTDCDWDGLRPVASMHNHSFNSGKKTYVKQIGDFFSGFLTWTSLTTADVCWAGSWWRRDGMTSEGSSWVKTVVRLAETSVILIPEGWSVLQREDSLWGVSSGSVWGGDWPSAAAPSESWSAAAALWQWTCHSSLMKVKN